jgi:carbonic anhydrase
MRVAMGVTDDMLATANGRAAQLAAPGLSPRPRRRVAVLACMDTRLDLFPMLGLEHGDAHIIRNAGGLVTTDAIRSLSASQRLLGTQEIVVVMHDDIDAKLREGLQKLRSSPELPARELIRGFVFNPDDGTLREVRGDAGS